MTLSENGEELVHCLNCTKQLFAFCLLSSELLHHTCSLVQGPCVCVCLRDRERYLPSLYTDSSHVMFWFAVSMSTSTQSCYSVLFASVLCCRRIVVSFVTHTDRRLRGAPFQTKHQQQQKTHKVSCPNNQRCDLDFAPQILLLINIITIVCIYIFLIVCYTEFSCKILTIPIPFFFLVMKGY